MHGHQHTYTEIYIHACIHEFIHKNKPPPIITSTTDKGENDIHSFIQSEYLHSASLSPLLLRGAPDHSIIDSVGVYTTKHYRQPHTVYTVHNQCSNCQGVGGSTPTSSCRPPTSGQNSTRGVEFQPPPS